MLDAASPVLQAEDGSILTSCTMALKELASFWMCVINLTANGPLSLRLFRHICQQSNLPPITVADLKAAVKRTQAKSGGPDGLTPEQLNHLPDGALNRLCDWPPRRAPL